MPHSCKLSRSRILRDSSASASATTITATAAAIPFLDFLFPAIHTSTTASNRVRPRAPSRLAGRHVPSESIFYAALHQASSCDLHKQRSRTLISHLPHLRAQRRHASSSVAPLKSDGFNHQRFDQKGRLIIETTAARQPAFAYDRPRHDKADGRKELEFAANSRLPANFFSDVDSVRRLISIPSTNKTLDRRKDEHTSAHRPRSAEVKEDPVKLLQSVRELEEKLERAKQKLARSMGATSLRPDSAPRSVTVLQKKDYLNLVDLYFYSHNTRFSPESTDASPTPVFLDDYSFTLSADFTKGDEPDLPDDIEAYVSPLKEIEAQLKKDKLREIVVMQVFVDLLLDDRSSNRALYEAYRELPHPGVSFLPKGVVRLFLQRMSTPWVKTQASKLRYLALIDDMQEAKVPITVAEWSSAIYLAGRSFSRIETGEVTKALDIWRQMENDAGVRSSNVTFNILFDVAVRAGKFALGETILQEMHNRNLRLNRLGRVSLMYYHGLRGDGDGVRKAYRDFVEAGEIVDTLVLNCVIASLINAQEPTAAEQTYERMKDMQNNLRRGRDHDGRDSLFKLHPEPGSNRLGDQMASNELGRILERAPNLREMLPEKHEELQSLMPLTPNFTTFRILLAYHTTVSGDLDRATILLKEMLEYFDIPLFAVVFQLLFKGFAIHGPQGGPRSAWSKARLDATWNACRTAILDSYRVAYGKDFRPHIHLPSITDVNKGMSSVTEASSQNESRSRTLSLWEELVVDLAAFPRERLKRVQRFHNTQFDEETSLEGFQSPFFQETHYSAPQPDLDLEEGEYTLPSPLRSTVGNPSYENYNPYDDEDGDNALSFNSSDAHMHEEWDRPPDSPQEGIQYSRFSYFDPQAQEQKKFEYTYHLHVSKPMVCWLLRAYSRVSGSRAEVEDVWGRIRKLWQPKTDQEAQVVIKVLLRCLRDCDRLSGRG